MAGRGYAQIFTSIWSDRDFRAISPAAQRHYFVLLSQPDMNYAGLLPLTERRWANCCEGTSLADVEQATIELAQRRYLIVDYDTEELFVRSFMRNDGLWKQPRMLAVAAREALATTSARLREALAQELGRIRDLLPEREPVDNRVIMVDNTIKSLLGGPGGTPPEALAIPLGRGPRAQRAAPAPTPAPNTGTPRAAAREVTPDRAHGEDPACDCAPAIAREEPPPPSIPDPPPGPAVTGPSAADAYRLVDSAIGREHPHTVRTALAIEVGALLVVDTDRELVFAALGLWLDKPHLGPKSLPSLVSEVIRTRNRTASRSRPSTTDQRVQAGLDLAAELRAESDQRAIDAFAPISPPELRVVGGEP